MARECEICGKKTVFGMQYSRRGLAKRKGGVGRRITGKSKRTFKPNIQRVRALVDGKVTRIKVCVHCIRAGKIQKAPRKIREKAVVSENGARAAIERAVGAPAVEEKKEDSGLPADAGDEASGEVDTGAVES